jgi:hypothetical protein
VAGPKQPYARKDNIVQLILQIIIFKVEILNSNPMRTFSKLIIALLAFFFCKTSNAQMEPSSELYRSVQDLDSILFINGFNNCMLQEMDPYIAKDLEFYHDQSGISTSKEEFFEAINQNICSNWDKKPIRKLVKGSMEVFPLYNNGVIYGAIQNGVHQFYIKESDKEPYLTSTAKFTHVFTMQDNLWQLKRVLSYDHNSPEQ